MDTVFYLSRSSGDPDSLVLPYELPENHYAPGCFYLMQKVVEAPAQTYQFPAVLKGELIYPDIERLEDSEPMFIANVKTVGYFYFFAERMRSNPKYEGSNPLLIGKGGSYRLRSWKPLALEKACFEQDFFFTGYFDTERQA